MNLEGTGEQIKPEHVSLERILDPKHCALLVIDVQNDFFHEEGFFAKKLQADVTPMRQAVPHIKDLIAEARRAHVPVIYTKGYEDTKFRGGPGMRRYYKWEGPSMVNSEQGTHGAEFYEVEPSEGEVVLEKYDWSAFSGKDPQGKTLDDILKEKGVSTLVITGVKTEVCVGTTVREAHRKGLFVVVPREAVGSDDLKQHEAQLENFDPIYGDVVPKDTVIEHWQDKPQNE